VSKLQKEVDRLEGANLFSTRWRCVLCSRIFVFIAMSSELGRCQLRGCVELVCISLYVLACSNNLVRNSRDINRLTIVVDFCTTMVTIVN
jgi:hypothetical protein